MRKTGLLVCLAALACGLYAVHATGTIINEADCVAAEDFTLDFNLGGLYSEDTDLVDKTADIGGIASVSFSALNDPNGTTNHAKYYQNDGGIRFYGANVMSLSMNAGMLLNSIELGKYGNYSWNNMIVASSSSFEIASDNSETYKIVFDSPVSSFTLQNGKNYNDKQVRFNKIKLSYTNGDVGGSSSEDGNSSSSEGETVNQWTEILDYDSLKLAGGGYSKGTVTIEQTTYQRMAMLNSKCIQLKDKGGSGIISTETVDGARVSAISITWASNNMNGSADNLVVYGSNVVPSLTNKDFEKDKLLTSVYGNVEPEVSNDFDVSGDYNYISFYAEKGAILIRSISVTWELPSQGSTAELEAQQWAETFLSKENGIVCDPNGLQMPDADKWMELGLLYLDLSDEAQNVLQAAEANELGSVVEQAVARYDYIVAKYNPENDPSSDYENYMGREVGPMAAFAGQGLNNESGINVAIFAVFAGISLAAGLGYFFYRKRKQA